MNAGSALVLLTPDRFHIDRDLYFDGGPTVVVEIRSRGDETIEKLPFYARIGVLEVWIIDRDTKAPQIHVLTGAEFEQQSPRADDWLSSPATGVQLHEESDRKLGIRLASDPSSAQRLPEV